MAVAQDTARVDHDERLAAILEPAIFGGNYFFKCYYRKAVALEEQLYNDQLRSGLARAQVDYRASLC